MVFNGLENRYLVVYEYDVNGNPDVFGIYVSADGTGKTLAVPIASQVTLEERRPAVANRAGTPSVVSMVAITDHALDPGRSAVAWGVSSNDVPDPGRFLVVWPDGNLIQSRRVSAMAYNPTLGDALMVWQDQGHATDPGLTGVWGRVWTGLLSADGFESGDTSEWSSAVP